MSNSDRTSSESTDFRRFANRLVLFSIPLWLYVAGVYLTDPFDFFEGPDLVSEEVKVKTVSPLNYVLWKMTKFSRDPSPNIMLGDSRMDAVPAGRVSELTHEHFANMAYGGASLRESIETFWFANRRVPLRRVYFGINFETYNDYALMNRTKTYQDLEQTPALYFVNRTVLQGTANSLYSTLLHKDLKIGKPDMTREAFWDYQVNGPETTRLFKNYIYPEKYKAELVKLGQFAKEHDIQMTFVIFPTHTDIQARFAVFGLEHQRQLMIQDLAKIAPVLDFDYPNALTSDANNFLDPFHLSHAGISSLVDEIWGGRQVYAQRH